MILKFDRIDEEIKIDSSSITTVEIMDRIEFSRIVESLLSEKGLDGVEPYALTSGGGETIKPKKAMILCSSLPNLPFSDRALITGLYERIAREIRDQPLLDVEVNNLAISLREEIADVQHELLGSYVFSAVWASEAFLKAFSFSPDVGEDDDFLERCKVFVGLCADAAPQMPICFVNLKSFLDGNSLEDLYESIFSLGEAAVLLESWHDENEHDRERKIAIDLQFLEN